MAEHSNAMSSSPQKLVVEVQGDHLRKLAALKKPAIAIAELIWNALDADARTVTVILTRNDLGGVEEIEIRDDGTGITWQMAETAFAQLGGSWKPKAQKTPEGRALHGAKGQGRFRAFGLGKRVCWTSWSTGVDSVQGVAIIGDIATIREFRLEKPKGRKQRRTGTSVLVTDIVDDHGLTGDAILSGLAEALSPYLVQYPGISIVYDEQEVSASKFIKSHSTYPITIEHENEQIDAALQIIEWNSDFDRRLYLCTKLGFALAEFPMRIKAPGFNFCAYLCCEKFEEFENSGLLDLADMHPLIAKLTETAKQQIKNYYEQVRAEETSRRLEQWKQDDIYPFTGNATSNVDIARRQVFDICAVQIDDHLPGFKKDAPRTKRLTFSLLKKALDRDPDDTRKIVDEVLGLTDDERRDFAELLDNTSLRAIVRASKTVADRLEFLKGLEVLVFDYKDQLKERSQLHKLLEENSWIFGEEYHLTNSDESLTTVLRKYRRDHGLSTYGLDPVRSVIGKSQEIVDMVMCRRIPLPNDERHHLVVELKRPKVKLDDAILAQTKGYAFSVAKDERFLHTKTKWIFWMVSSEMSETMEMEISQDGRDFGQAYRKQNIEIWAMTWGQLLNRCEARMRFFMECMEYSASTESALEHLKRVYSRYVPEMSQ